MFENLAEEFHGILNLFVSSLDRNHKTRKRNSDISYFSHGEHKTRVSDRLWKHMDHKQMRLTRINSDMGTEKSVGSGIVFKQERIVFSRGFPLPRPPFSPWSTDLSAWKKISNTAINFHSNKVPTYQRSPKLTIQIISQKIAIVIYQGPGKYLL